MGYGHYPCWWIEVEGKDFIKYLLDNDNYRKKLKKRYEDITSSNAFNLEDFDINLHARLFESLQDLKIEYVEDGTDCEPESNIIYIGSYGSPEEFIKLIAILSILDQENIFRITMGEGCCYLIKFNIKYGEIFNIDEYHEELEPGDDYWETNEIDLKNIIGQTIIVVNDVLESDRI